MNKNDNIYYSNEGAKWKYRLSGYDSIGFSSKKAAAQAYVKDYISRNPKYKLLIEGKKWDAIFRIMGINV